jgi:D-threo-aldose 1-dehydrogenase
MKEAFDREVSEKSAVETLLEAFKSEVSFFDTASIYGESEKRIGLAIKKRGGLPEEAIIATKADRDVNNNEFSAEQTRKSVMNSCELLGIQPLPLVYLHDPEHDAKYHLDKKAAFKRMVAKGGPVAELEKLKEEGVILNIGISGGPIDMMIEYIRTGRFDVVITHNRWNLLWQTANTLIEEARQMGIGIVNAAPYASGILATGACEGARAAYQLAKPEDKERADKMSAVCQRFKIPLRAAALQFSLRDKRINATAVGIASPQQVIDTIHLAQLPIPDGVWEELNPLAIKTGDPETNRK